MLTVLWTSSGIDEEHDEYPFISIYYPPYTMKNSQKPQQTLATEGGEGIGSDQQGATLHL